MSEDIVIKIIIGCIITLFILVILAIIMSAIALANRGSSGNTGFKVIKVTSTGNTNITVINPIYVQAMVSATTGSAIINFTGQNGSVALVRNSGSNADVILTSNNDMYVLSGQNVDQFKIRTNSYALLIWNNDNTYIAPF